jgi:PDZ domain-containing protein
LRVTDRSGDGAGSRYVLLLTSSLSLIAIISVLGLLPIPYLSLRPGPAVDTLGEFGDEPMITFGKSAKTYPTRGRLDFTSVMVTRSDHTFTLLDGIDAYFEPDTEVVPRALLYGDDESAEQTDKKLEQQMTSAKDFSQYAALRAAGYDVRLDTTVASVEKGLPADGVLRKADIITAVDGRKKAAVRDVVDAVSSHKPGEKVTLTVLRGSEELTVTLGTVRHPDDRKRARVGVALRATVDYPFKITNHVAKIGGPSAGAMFALAIYDRLTPGALTGGRHVAGTGTILPDGQIGPIGSIRQKMAGAGEAGASVFLVPAKNCREALRDADRFGRVDGMRLVRVKTLDGAIRALEALAEDPKASVPECAGPGGAR